MALLFLCLFVAGIVSSTLAQPWVPVASPDQNWMNRFQLNVENSRVNASNINVLFYGDSITRHFDPEVWDTAFEPLGAANYGIGGDTTQQVLWRIQNGEVDNISPRIVVVMIGTNNLGRYSEDDIARGITTIVDELLSRLPNTRILLLGILPRNNSATTAIAERINTIVSARENLNNIRFLNMRDGFYRGNGQFYTERYTGDLLHINAAGYWKWEELMNPLFTQMWNTT